MKNILFIVFILGMICLTGCKVFQPSVMLKTPKDYSFSETPNPISLEYKISANDIVDFRLFSNNGFKLIDLVTSGNGNNLDNSQGSITYLIQADGTAKLPIIGRIELAGLTIRECELKLEELFSKYYNKPYATISVKNKRVIVFPGTGSDAKVIPLVNENVTLIEALALAGGITGTGKAHRIKLIRNEKGEERVFLFDLSTILGMDGAKMILQANDIIYVEPQIHIVQEILAEITPIISLISSTIVIIALFRTNIPTN